MPNVFRHYQAILTSKLSKVLAVFMFSIVFTTLNLHCATLNVVISTDQFSTDSQCSLREAIVNATNNNQSGSTDCTGGVI